MTVAEFQTAFPVFAAVSAPDITRHMTTAGRFVETVLWGDRYDLGFGNVVAHFIKVEQLNATGGGADDAVEKRVGQVSVMRSAAMLEKQMVDPFLRTSYGRMYRYLARQLGVGALAV